MTDSEKLGVLYELYEKPLYRIAMAILHSHEQAEDAVHDTFCKVARHLAKLDAPDSPQTKGYMIAAVRSAACRQYRRNERQNAYSAPLSEETAQIPDERDSLQAHIRQNELRDTLNALLNSLSDLDRSIVLLHCRDDLTFGEIGRQLGITEAAARKRFERARKILIKKKGALSDEA